VASPWFPQNVSYLVFHTVFKTGSDDPFLVGTEWLKPDWRLLVGGSLVAHVMVVTAPATLLGARRRGELTALRAESVAAAILTTIFFVMNARSWRFVEYYAPFAVVTAALLLRDAGVASPARVSSRRLFGGALTIALAAGIWTGLGTLRHGKGESFYAFADFMRYVDAHDEHPLVFDTYWSDFQHMVFWSDRARYVAGLDGNYLRFGDPARFRLWYDFSTGARLDRNDNARAIGRAFGARWIVVSRYQPQLADNLARDAHAELVMARPDSGWLFEVKP
jgi:hypothetical protein